MLVPLSWIKNLISLEESPEEIADLLTLAGLEVDKIERKKFSFSGVVIGEILEVEQHPNADNLNVAIVSDGKEKYQVVCAAKNCRVGLKTAFAKVGATLTDLKGKTIKIKEAKVRDIASSGMLASGQELSLSEDNEGILELENDLETGTDLQTLFDDTIFEISLTPNLGHCASILGIARELGALLNREVQIPPSSIESELEDTHYIDIENFSPDKCHHYATRLVKNIEVGPSPTWLKNKLESSGIRSINNVVDVTNFVMLELGQPLHGFDYDKITEKKIVIREVNPEDQPLETLDGEKRDLHEGILLICDPKAPLAVAGVMGGEDSAISFGSKNVLLESAHFDASAIRYSSKKLSLRTESSSRFEKGVDPEGVNLALNRAAYLLQTIAKGDAESHSIQSCDFPYTPKTISLRVSRVNTLLGTKLSFGEIESFLNRLKMTTKSQEENILLVTPPSYRNDVKEEIDLVEEVARMYGFNNIDTSRPSYTQTSLPHSPIYLLEKEIRTHLIAENLQEFITCDLLSPELAKLSCVDEFSEDSLIEVIHPSSVDQSVLRASMLPSLLHVLKRNFDHGTKNISCFEIGNIHFKIGTQYKERLSLGIMLSGASTPYHYENKPEPVDFFHLKGIVENLLEGCNFKNANFVNSKLKTFHPGIQAKLDLGSLSIGALGEVHPLLLKELDIKEKVFFAQIDINDLLQMQEPFKQMNPLPQYPGSERDWTATLSESIPFSSIEETIQSVPSKLLKGVKLLDIYRNEKLGSDKKNVTLRFTYRDDTKTVDSKKVEKEHARILSALESTLL